MIRNTTPLLKKDEIYPIDTKKVTPDILSEVYNIEQDLWARFLGEYLKCCDCENIYSKDEVYGGFDMSDYQMNIRNNTVSELQIILDDCPFNCQKCGGEVEEIFGYKFQDEIRSRYDFEKSFLLIHSGINRKVLGYVDAYISDFDTLYNRELEYYYAKLGKDEIRIKLENILETSVPDEMIWFGGVGHRPDAANIKNLYEIFKKMFQVMSVSEPNVVGLYETVLGTPTHMILDICKAQRIYTSQDDHQNINKKFITDIFIHPNMAEIGLDILGSNFKDFIRTNKKRINELRK